MVLKGKKIQVNYFADVKIAKEVKGGREGEREGGREGERETHLSDRRERC